MDKRKFEFYCVSEFEHSVEVMASSAEEALTIAVEKCESGAPGVFVDHFVPFIAEIAPDGSRVREWQFDEDLGLIEQY